MSESAPASVSVETEETSPVLRTLAVEVDRGRVRKAFDRAYRELAKSARIKGFRPGKAPRSVLEKLYGPGLAEELERRIVTETLPEAIEGSGVAPVAEPSVESAPPRPDEPFRYKALVEVKPPIELPALVGLPASRPAISVSDEDVEAQLESLRERRASLEDEPEGTAAGTGSVLVIDYEGRIAGEPFEGGAAEGANVELGGGRLVPGFEEQLEGAVAGEEREVRITFPEDYGAEELAGKEAVFAVRVDAVKRRERPTLDDAFAKEVGDFETLDALRERIRSDLVAEAERAARTEARRTLMDALIEQTSFDVPPGLVDRRLAQRLQMAHDQLQGALPEEDLHRRLDAWRHEWRPDAERDVREALLLEAVADHQDIQVGDEEVDEKIEAQAREQGLAPARLRQRYEEKGLRGALAARIREEKALEFLLGGAKIEETSGT